MEIQNQKILITGANRGIGRAFAMICAESKAHLILVNRTEDPELEGELKKAGALSIQSLQVDLSSAQKTQAFLEQARHLEVDILFNNAGQMVGGQIEKQSTEEIQAMMQVNVLSLMALTQAFLPGMLTRMKGKIINHSSVVGFMPFPGASTYAASKSAVASFTNCLQGELKGTGVSTLLLVTPGVETRMFQAIPGQFGKNLDLSFLKSIPAKKYAEMIKEAVLEDLTELRPQGMTGWGLSIARHWPQAFQKAVSYRFKRQN